MQLWTVSRVQYRQGYFLEEILNGMGLVKRRSIMLARLLLASSIIICAAVSAAAQRGAMSPNQGENDGLLQEQSETCVD